MVTDSAVVTDQAWPIRDTNAGLLDAVAAGEGEPVRRCLYLVVRVGDALGPAARTFADLVRQRAQG